MDDAKTIVNLKSSYDDFKLHKAITFALDYKNKTKSFLLLAGTIGSKDIDMFAKKQK